VLLSWSVLLCTGSFAAEEKYAGAEPAYDEVWISPRGDGQAGTGTLTDPFDGGSVEKLNGLFEKFQAECGDHVTIHFGPGVFHGDRPWRPGNYWKILGAGMDVTVLRTQANPNARGDDVVGFLAPGKEGVELADLTIDFNVQNLGKANRVFAWNRKGRRRVTYYHAASIEPWSADMTYEKQKHRRQLVVEHRGREYILLGRESRGQAPDESDLWARVHPVSPASLPPWNSKTGYVFGDAVAVDDRGYLCLADESSTDPRKDAEAWKPIDGQPIDPSLYTKGFLGSRRCRVRRVHFTNSYGSKHLNQECFVVHLSGGGQNVVEDCYVDRFHGDYCTMLAMADGPNNVIRNCVVRDTFGRMTFGYGGWRLSDAVFEGNLAWNVASSTNIDSLQNRNVTFRNNTFLNCRSAGMLVNVSGSERSRLDGLFIHDNFFELCDDAAFAGIQLQAAGLSNVVVRNNVIRTVSGNGNGRSAINVSRANGVVLLGNVCEPGMRCRVPESAKCLHNFDFRGQPIPGLQGR